MVASEHSSYLLCTRGTLRSLLLLHCLFIIYGSFIPFQINLDLDFARWRLDIFLSVTSGTGVWTYSTPDLVSNVLLFVPFGLLLIGAVSNRRERRRSAALLLGGLLGAMFGLIVELAQLFMPSRTPSILDVICNGTGAAIGACIGHILFQELREVLDNLLRKNDPYY